LPFDVEEFARAALVRILPRSRYRLAAQNDARFQSFAGNTVRIAYRQQGGTPAFLLFCGPGQNPQSAAMAAAAWAEANWRPNAIQRRVRPGVVVVHVAPGNQLTPAGPVPAAVVPSAIWTVDSATGKVETAGSPPGSPPASDLRRSATSLMRGEAAPTLGELDLAEKGVMHLRTVAMPRFVNAFLGVLLFVFALRYGLAGIGSLMLLPLMLSGGVTQAGGLGLILAEEVINVLLLAGILLGAGILFNFRNMALRVPGFSSTVPGTRNVVWGAYLAGMIGLAVALDGVVIPAERHPVPTNPSTQYQHVTATVTEDGTDTYVQAGGDLTVDLSGWPSTEWPGVTFKTSNPSVMSLDTPPAEGGHPVAKFGAHQVGTARVEAASADGRYTYLLRVNVFNPSTPGSGP
jgi:hypothetical protein